jgi:hypothetical protein
VAALNLVRSGSGQERRIGAVRNISALPPRADVRADIVEPPVSAINGRQPTDRSSLRAARAYAPARKTA